MNRRLMFSALAMLFFAVLATVLGQEKKPAEQPTEYIRIEIKGKLLVEPIGRDGQTYAKIGGWSVPLMDRNNKPLPDLIKQAKKLDGKLVIVTGTPEIWVGDGPRSGELVMAKPKFGATLLVRDVTIKSAEPE
jgi:hypothetical protein